jgi:hypothetical protein
MRRALLLVLALLPLACQVKVNEGDASEPKPDADPSAASDGGGEGAVAEPESEGADPVRAPVASSELPACPADAGADAYCTEDGKLAGRWVPVDTLKVPEDAELVFDAAHPDDEGQPSLSVAIHGETLYLRHVTCGSCRRVIGQGFSGAVARMTEDQRAAMQAKLGLAAELPVLADIEGWRAFASDERGAAALTELSTNTELGGGGGR